MFVAATRPEKITQFLSHMFPTERDRLYFELIMDSADWDPEEKWINRIELEISNPSYITKYRSLRRKRDEEIGSETGIELGFVDDFQTPDKILSDIYNNPNTIIVNLYSTRKPKKRQTNFINRMCSAETKEKYGEEYYNTNSYVFIVKESLFKNGGFKGFGWFTTYSLTNYNDKEYEFTENDKEAYCNYLSDLRSAVGDACEGKWHLVNELQDEIDIYLEAVNKIEQK